MAKFCLHIILLVVILQTHLTKSETQQEHNDHWIVQTSTGPVEGIVNTVPDEMQVYTFYGIPYAKPPVGELRFKPPQPVQPWTDVLKTLKKPLPCYQHLKRAKMFRINYDETRIYRPWSEDCLNLNIWVPKPRVENAPVLVSIHQGVFEFGSNNYPDGSVLSSKSRVIIVSMNYRLGPFGFLNFGVPDAPGNMGLLDQQLALKWIHENVQLFGGLTKAVILVGSGDAGAASVGYHVLAPGSKEYFTSIVPISGSPTCSWAFQENDTSISNSKMLSQRLDCSNGTVDEELACLRMTHAEDIIDAYMSYPTRSSNRLMPTVDGTFIKEKPLEALDNGHFKKAVSIALLSAHEGSLALSAVNVDLMPKPEEGMALEHFLKAIKRIAPDLSKAGLDVVQEFYIDKCHDKNPQEIRDAAINLYSNVLIDCCMNQFNERFVEKGGAVFLSVSNVKKDSDPEWVGCSHAAAMDYGFGLPYINTGHSKVEVEVSRQFMNWITKQSRMAADASNDLIPFDAKDKNYTLWKIDGPRYFSHYKEKECRLWNEIIPKLQSPQICRHV